MSLYWDDVDYFVGKKQVLHRCSGSASGGELLAIMGPSGSGKTSLLHVLAQRITPGPHVRVHGTILVNGRRIDKRARKLCAMVFQDEVLLHNLTVRQAIYFAARLKLPQRLSVKEVEGFVDATIELLGLQRCADTKIGRPKARGVSGGEKKRAAIAIELVAQPKILFLDEPTSGLDAATALALGRTLQRLAVEKGLLVLCAIHQPRAALFDLFTKVLLLRQGRMAFFGSNEGDDIIRVFESAAQARIPPHISVSDWLLDVLCAVDEKLLARKGGDAEAKKEASEEGLPLSGAGDVEAAGRASEALEAAARAAAAAVERPAPMAAADRSVEGNSIRFQFWVLLQLQGAQQRGEVFSYVHVFQILTVAVIASLVWWQSENWEDVMGIIFFCNIQQSFNSMNTVLRVFPPERQWMLRNRDGGVFQTLPYFLAKSCADLSSLFLWPIVYAVIIYFSAGLRNTAEHFFIFLLLFVLSITTASSIGLFIGATITDTVVANSTNFVVVLIIMLNAGFYANVDNSSVAGVLKYASFMFYSFSGMMHNEFAGRNLGCGAARPGEFTPNCLDSASDEERGAGFSGDLVLEATGFDDDTNRPFVACLVLIGIAVVFRALTYAALRKRFTIV